ncbi:MAG TPA: hypothetical protein VFQ12_09465 [Thermoleophilaceae bacterium]|nr:hypothetical protein [Thermoleophilaceae bacterium]
MRATVLSYGLRPAGAALRLGNRLARDASSAAADAAGRTVLAGLDALLGWRYTDEAVARVLASPVADRAVGSALSGPLVDAVARDVARYAVLERVVDELLASGMADQLADRLLDGPELERVVAGALESSGMERLVQGVVESPAMERLATRAIESRLVDRVLDTVVERLPESEELWLLVDQIARSPAVTEAIAQQSMGFADQVAGEVRLRSQGADAGLERVARRLLRREPPPSGPVEGDAG